jgi:hypothetical protein
MAWTTYNTGTTTTSSTWTSSGGTVTTVRSLDHLHFKKAAKAAPVKRDPFVKKGFWDDVEWKEHTSYFPRKSITGKIIIGKMHKRWRTPEPRMRGQGLGNFTQYAKTKELFEEKLRGKA